MLTNLNKLEQSNTDRTTALFRSELEQALALHQAGQLAQAKALYENIIKANPWHFDALHLSGITSLQIKDYSIAVDLINRAIVINPQFAAAYNNLATALKALKQYDAALQNYDKAISLKPDFVDAYYNRGILLDELKLYEAALQSFDKTVLLKPDHTAAYNNRGNTLQKLCKFDQAISSYDKVIAAKPGSAEAYDNRGAALKALKQFDAALLSYEKSIEIQPDYVGGHWNKSVVLLLLGNFEQGWEGYEWRWKNDSLELSRRSFTQPLWLGKESLQGKTILLHSEQGLGDGIQFCRYAKMVADLGARVVLEVHKPLLNISGSLEGISQLVVNGSALPEFDYHCPLLSLPLAFKTNLDNIPVSIPYLSADASKVAEWQVKLGEKNKLRVGLVWSGNAQHKNDHNRSILLTELLLQLPENSQYVSLQKEVREDDKETLLLRSDILHFGDELKDFSDTAALCELMDVIISIDTSVAHLAGALGKQVWILLPFDPDWRWLLDRDDSPWYPTAKLYRQEKIGVWDAVLARVKMDLLGMNSAQYGDDEQTRFSKYVQQKMEQALALHQQGQLPQAQAFYDEILKIQPQHINALHLSSVIALQTNDPVHALELTKQALEINPQFAIVHYNQGNALKRLGQNEAALHSFDAAIILKPDFADAYFNRGNVLRGLKQYDAALLSYEKAIECMPEYAEAYFNRGNLQAEMKQLDAALLSFDKVIELKPDYVEAYNNRGSLLMGLKQFDAALASFDKAIALKPDYADAYFNRGNLLKKISQFDAALLSYDKAIFLKPDYAEAYNYRGEVLHVLQQYDAALQCFDKAISLRPDFAAAFRNRGIVLKDLRQFDAALQSYDTAIALQPDYAEAYFNRGNALRELKQLEAAVKSYDKVIELKPDFRFLYGYCLHTKMQVCDWSNAESQFAELEQRLLRNEMVSLPFPALAISNSPLTQRKAAEIFINEMHPAVPDLGGISTRIRHEKIRIGYFSADFRNHPVALLMEELFKTHDRTKFEVYAFSFGPDTKDELRIKLEGMFDQFLDVRNKTDEDIARLSRNFGIDIAVDLMGFTAESRTGIFALRAAPVQVSYIGYLGTMGAAYIDYLIADTTIIPQHCQKFYSEKIAYLPSYQANNAKRKISERIFTRKELGLPDNGFVFCCFNSNYKITPDTFDGWMRILKQVDQSVLFLYVDNDVAIANLRKEAVSRGVDSARLVFGKRLPPPEYLARYRAADLFLDTLPYNAGTTASDALWAGLPVLTCMGASFASRVAASLLKAIHLPELITSSQEDFEAMAIELATSPEMIKQIKQKLERNRLTTPLFDATLFTRNIEDAYIQMVERYLTNLAPDHIYVERDAKFL